MAFLIIFDFKKHIIMNSEKVFDFGKSYLQLNYDQCFGLGINLNKKGIELVLLCFYIGFWFKN